MYIGHKNYYHQFNKCNPVLFDNTTIKLKVLKNLFLTKRSLIDHAEQVTICTENIIHDKQLKLSYSNINKT